MYSNIDRPYHSKGRQQTHLQIVDETQQVKNAFVCFLASGIWNFIKILIE